MNEVMVLDPTGRGTGDGQVSRAGAAGLLEPEQWSSLALPGRPQYLAGAAEARLGSELTSPAASLSHGCPGWGRWGLCLGLRPYGAGAGEAGVLVASGPGGGEGGKQACVHKAGAGCADLQSVFRSTASPWDLPPALGW